MRRGLIPESHIFLRVEQTPEVDRLVAQDEYAAMGMSAPAGAYGAPPGAYASPYAPPMGAASVGDHSSEALMQMLQHQTSMTQKWQAMLAEQQRAHRRLAQLERATEEFRRVEAYAVQQFVRHEPNRPIKLEPHVVLEVRILDWRYDGRSAAASGGEGSSSSGGGEEGEAHSLYAVHGVDRHPCGPADDWRVSIDVGSEAVEELGIELWGSALLGAADVHVLKLLRGELT